MTSNAEHVKPWVPPALGYPKAISFPWPFHPVALLLFLTNTTSLATSQWKSVHVSKRSVQMMHPTKIKDQHLKHLAFVGPHLNPSLKPKEARTGRRFLFQPQGRSYGPMALINMLAMISMSLELHHAHTFTPSGCKGFNCQRQQNCIKPVRSYSTNSQNTAHLCYKNTMNTIDLLHNFLQQHAFFWLNSSRNVYMFYFPPRKKTKKYQPSLRLPSSWDGNIHPKNRRTGPASPGASAHRGRSSSQANGHQRNSFSNIRRPKKNVPSILSCWIFYSNFYWILLILR